MYVNVKSKCARSHIGRVCVQDLCMHAAVVLSVGPPILAGGCISKIQENEAIVRLWNRGVETRDLFSAVRDLRASVSRLYHQHGFLGRCYRCG